MDRWGTTDDLAPNPPFLSSLGFPHSGQCQARPFRDVVFPSLSLPASSSPSLDRPCMTVWQALLTCNVAVPFSFRCLTVVRGLRNGLILFRTSSLVMCSKRDAEEFSEAPSPCPAWSMHACILLSAVNVQDWRTKNMTRERTTIFELSAIYLSLNGIKFRVLLWPGRSWREFQV